MYFEETDSSEDEDFLCDDNRNGPSINNPPNNSMYSRIYEDVRLQIPNIQLDTFQDDNAIDLANGYESAGESEDVEGDGKRTHLLGSNIIKGNDDDENVITSIEIAVNTDEDNFKSCTITGGTQTGINDADVSAGTMQQNIGTSTNNSKKSSHFAMSSRSGTLSLSLDLNVEMDEIDMALERIGDSSLSSNAVTRSTSSQDFGEEEQDTENRLLSKLSSYSLHEKETTSKVNELLGKFSLVVNKKKTAEKEHPGDKDEDEEVIGSKQSDGSIMKEQAALSELVEDDKSENATIFLDLRKDVQDAIVKNSTDPVLKEATQENSDSGSDDEDWNLMRRAIKSGIDVNIAKSDKRNTRVTDNDMHFYSQRFRQEGATQTKESNPDKSFGLFNAKTVRKDFDIEPFAEKIRSWCQFEKNQEKEGDYQAEQNIKTKQNNSLICDEQFETSNDGEVLVAGEQSQAKLVKEMKEEHTVENEEDINCVEKKNELSKRHQMFGHIENEKLSKQRILSNDTSLLKLESIPSKKDEVMMDLSSSTSLKNHLFLKDVDDSVSPVQSNMDASENIRITDNLMLIKADISAGDNNGDLFNGNIEIIPHDKDVGMHAAANRSNVVLGKKEKKGDVDQIEDVSGNTDDRRSSKKSEGMVEKNDSWRNMINTDCTESETKQCIELTTFSMKTKARSNDMVKDVTSSDKSTKLKGLISTNVKVINSTVTGEETPLIKKEKLSRPSSRENSYSKNSTRRNKTSFSDEKLDNVDQNLNVKNKELWTQNSSEKSGSMENLSSSKSKKKSKRKNNKHNEEMKSVVKGEKDLGMDKNRLDKFVSNESEDKKKVKSLNIKENEKLKIQQHIELLEAEYGASNVIYHEKHSYDAAFGCITKSAEKSSKLLLQINLQCPGICDRSCVKNSLTFQERSDAYVGLCTFFLSTLYGNKYKTCELLEIPFSVVAFQQSCIDAELCLFIGVVENEIPSFVSQKSKRGKQRKSFHQTVQQYLNKTDLEDVLSKLMMFNATEMTGKEKISPTRRTQCPGSKKLSSYVKVSQDEAATDRIFGLKPSLLWNNMMQAREDALVTSIAWIPFQEKKNENTVVLIDNMTSLLPKFICEFMKATRENGMDISGIRMLYINGADGKEIAYLVAALRGPNVTKVQAGAPGDKTFQTIITDPLLTYNIGKGRGESEVVRLFGCHIEKLSDIIEIENNNLITLSKAEMSERGGHDVLHKTTPTSSLLSVCNGKVLLSLSSLVPSVFLLAAIRLAESRGIYPVCIGKCLVNEDDMITIGLRMVTQDDNVIEEKNKKQLDMGRKNSVLLIVFEGENALYRSIGLVNALYKELNAKLPKETFQGASTGLSNFEKMQTRRHINDFFSICPINKKIIKVLDHMTAPHFSPKDSDIMSRIPPSLNRAYIHESPDINVVVFVGEPMLEMTSFILRTLFSTCMDDPLCVQDETCGDEAFLFQERPAAEIVAIKHFSSLPKHMAHVCSRFHVGSRDWSNTVDNLESGPVLLLVIKWTRMPATLDVYCEKIRRCIGMKLKSRELASSVDSFYDAYTFSDLDIVLPIILTMFDANELTQDACRSWYKHTQWPLYIDRNSKLIRSLHSYLGNFLDNSIQQSGFKDNKQQQCNSIRILSPLTFNLPIDIILAMQQRSLSFIKFEVDNNFSKYIPKTLNVLRRDSFKIVGLNFPGSLLPSFETIPKMHVAVSRVNAVYRLNQWRPELLRDLYDKHTLYVSPTASRAYGDITAHFQRSETGGVFEDSLLTKAEKKFLNLRIIALRFDNFDLIGPVESAVSLFKIVTLFLLDTRAFAETTSDVITITMTQVNVTDIPLKYCDVDKIPIKGNKNTYKISELPIVADIEVMTLIMDTAMALKFRDDDVFACKDFRRVEWIQNLPNNKSVVINEETAKHRTKNASLRDEINCLVTLEVTVIIMTNATLRGTYLGHRLSENVQYLGLWEKLSSLGFKTIAARMTSLKEDQTEFLLKKFDHLTEKQYCAMLNRLSEGNGPIFALALLGKCALSNFWGILNRVLTEKELKSIQPNVLVPSSRDQVEVLLGSLFETVVANSQVEIKKQKS
eukprot:gene11088-12256_t